MATKAGFKFFSNQGFQITFKNGFTVSLSAVAGSYSDNHKKFPSDISPKMNAVESIECAVWDDSKDGAPFLKLSQYDDVLGYLSSEQIASIIEVVAKAKTAEEIEEKIQKFGF